MGLICSVIGHAVSLKKENGQAVSGKSLRREMRGIDMKTTGPKEVKPLLKTKELVQVVLRRRQPPSSDKSIMKHSLDT